MWLEHLMHRSGKAETNEIKTYKKSYIQVLCLGAIIGMITELLNFFPNDDLWGWSSIAGSFVFWIFSVTFIIYFSSSNKSWFGYHVHCTV